MAAAKRWGGGPLRVRVAAIPVRGFHEHCGRAGRGSAGPEHWVPRAPKVPGEEDRCVGEREADAGCAKDVPGAGEGEGRTFAQVHVLIEVGDAEQRERPLHVRQSEQRLWGIVLRVAAQGRVLRVPFLQ